MALTGKYANYKFDFSYIRKKDRPMTHEEIEKKIEEDSLYADELITKLLTGDDASILMDYYGGYSPIELAKRHDGYFDRHPEMRKYLNENN